MRWLLLSLLLGFLILDCQPNRIVEEDEIVDALRDGKVVHIEELDSEFVSVSIDGIVMGRSSKAITYDCFGQSWCIALDELFRAMIRTSTDDFAFYCGDCTGTTYFSTNYYTPYFYTNTFPLMNSSIDTAGYLSKIIAFCLTQPPESCGEFGAGDSDSDSDSDGDSDDD